MPFRGTLDALPLESWGMNNGRIGQPCADGAAYLFEVEQKRKWLSC